MGISKWNSFGRRMRGGRGRRRGRGGEGHGEVKKEIKRDPSRSR